MPVYLNRWYGIGRLGKDPERLDANGKTLARLSVGLHPPKSSRTTWIEVYVWDKTGEACIKHLAKGALVHVTAEIRRKAWDDKEGHKHFALEIHAIPGGVLFLERGPEGPDEEPEYE